METFTPNIFITIDCSHDLAINMFIYLLYGTTALEELWPPSNEDFFGQYK